MQRNYSASSYANARKHLRHRLEKIGFPLKSYFVCTYIFTHLHAQMEWESRKKIIKILKETISNERKEIVFVSDTSSRYFNNLHTHVNL